MGIIKKNKSKQKGKERKTTKEKETKKEKEWDSKPEILRELVLFYLKRRFNIYSTSVSIHKDLKKICQNGDGDVSRKEAFIEKFKDAISLPLSESDIEFFKSSEAPSKLSISKILETFIADNTVSIKNNSKRQSDDPSVYKNADKQKKAPPSVIINEYTVDNNIWRKETLDILKFSYLDDVSSITAKQMTKLYEDIGFGDTNLSNKDINFIVRVILYEIKSSERMGEFLENIPLFRLKEYMESIGLQSEDKRRVLISRLKQKIALSNAPPKKHQYNISDDSIDPQDFMCCICLEFLHDPITTNCGHSFCLRCVTPLKKKRCPVCQEKTQEWHNYKPSFMLKQVLIKHHPTLYEERSLELEEDLRKQMEMWKPIILDILKEKPCKLRNLLSYVKNIAFKKHKNHGVICKHTFIKYLQNLEKENLIVCYSSMIKSAYNPKKHFWMLADADVRRQLSSLEANFSCEFCGSRAVMALLLLKFKQIGETQLNSLSGTVYEEYLSKQNESHYNSNDSDEDEDEDGSSSEEDDYSSEEDDFSTDISEDDGFSDDESDMPPFW